MLTSRTWLGCAGLGPGARFWVRWAMQPLELLSRGLSAGGFIGRFRPGQSQTHLHPPFPLHPPLLRGEMGSRTQPGPGQSHFPSLWVEEVGVEHKHQCPPASGQRRDAACSTSQWLSSGVQSSIFVIRSSLRVSTEPQIPLHFYARQVSEIPWQRGASLITTFYHSAHSWKGIWDLDNGSVVQACASKTDAPVSAAK